MISNDLQKDQIGNPSQVETQEKSQYTPIGQEPKAPTEPDESQNSKLFK